MLKRLILAGLVLFVLAEILLRWPGHAEVRFKLADKQLHCIDDQGFRIYLCPDTRQSFQHPFGFNYTVSTDQRGERTVYTGDRTGPPGGTPAVWIIGDSIAMGYGQSDEDTFAARIAAQRPDVYVRNLGVDAVGAAGIRSLLEGAVSNLPADEERPTRVFWIMHMSDFIDDINDIHLQASTRIRFLRRLHFFASRYSAAYNFLKHTSEELRLSRKRNVYDKDAPTKPVPPPADHPTFANISATIDFARAQKFELIFVFYPNVDHATGRPGADYTLEKILQKHVTAAGARFIDTRPAFEAATGTSTEAALYLPTDGHPAPAASLIFAREILKEIP